MADSFQGVEHVLPRGISGQGSAAALGFDLQAPEDAIKDRDAVRPSVFNDIVTLHGPKRKNVAKAIPSLVDIQVRRH